MANPFVHVELQTTDLKKARDFYARLFDWKLEDAQVPGFGTSTMIGVGDGTGGGMMASPAPGVPSQWVAYVNVDDVASATRKAKDAGALRDGTLAGAAMDVFASEPVPKDHPLLSLENFLCTPHLGASTEEGQLACANQLAEQLVEYARTGHVRHALNAPGH